MEKTLELKTEFDTIKEERDFFKCNCHYGGKV